MTFAELEYDSTKRRTHREIFLEKMEGLIPWQQLEDRIEPFYPKAGRGRRPYPLGVMLRVHCVQLFYNVSDPGMEDLLYEVESVRRFAGLRLSGSLPDETTILNFRHLLETQCLGMGLFEEIMDLPRFRGRVSDEVFKLSLSPGRGKLPPRSGGVEHSDARDRRLYVRIRNRLTRIRPATPLSERLDARS